MEPRNQALEYSVLPTTYAAGPASNAAWVLAFIAVVLMLAGELDFWMPDFGFLLLVLGAICALAGAIAGVTRLRDARRSDFVGRGRAWIGIAGALLIPFAFMTGMHINNREDRLAQIKCSSNLRQIGQAIQMYANDNNGSYPASFAVLLGNIDLNPEAFVCPASHDEKAAGPTTQETLSEFGRPGHCSYVYLGAGASVSTPASFVVAYEPLEVHGRRGAHFLTRDGEVKWCHEGEAENVIQQLKAGVNPPK